MGIAEIYDFYWNQNVDPRNIVLPLMASPILIPTILASYLYFVLKCGPRYMKDKKPYDLKTFVKYYNIFQIVSNALIVQQFLSAGVLTEFSVICTLPNYTFDPKHVKIAYTFWWTLLLKLIDLIETGVFVLRKKDRQISFLHIYHHISTVIVVWTFGRYVPVAMASFAIIVNCIIHVIMYTYYYFSTMGDKAPKILKKIKPLITIMQMAQFVLLISQNIMSFLPSCPVARLPGIVSISNLVINFKLFYDFYQETYKKTNQKSM
ncbi:very long chain fatty acid elongase 1 [Megalopta genalis]|uniref:very long chain fatty acid elongase 1 n=1 Tax=Megalopta genalis TaxID=115081 RepID=UPI003FCF9C40